MSWLRTLALTLGLALPIAARAEVSLSPPPVAGVVNVGTASSDELERLPGIGEKKAAAIIEHRRGHPLKRLEDLAKVKGIGRKTVARLRPYLTLSGTTTLKERPSLRRR